MGEFSLDTSGDVWAPHGQLANTYWEDLSPFERGYIEALFAAWVASFPAPQERGVQRVQLRRIGFSDLAPATLAAIRKDCAEIGHGIGKFYADTQRQGGHFWDDRQHGTFKRLPPLLVTLDDGKVYARAVS